MVMLENIKQDGDIVLFDGYREGKKDDHFSMAVDIVNKKIISCSSEVCIYERQAFFKILTLSKTGEPFPEKVMSMWC